MKLKNGFMLKEIAGECVVVVVDKTLNLDGMITLNDTAKTIWLALEKGAEMDELVKALTDEYEVDEDTARFAADTFIAKLRELDFIEG
jgi:hypothetical protein